MLSSKKHSPYDQDIIIDLLSQDGNFSINALRIAKKYSRHMKLMDGKDFIKNMSSSNFASPIKSDNKKIRIYVIGHCLPASDTIYGWESKIPLDTKYKKIHYSDLASYLAKYIGKKNNNDITVNLVPCYAGRGSVDDNPTDSFGAKLHRALANLIGENTSVVARNETVCVMDDVRYYCCDPVVVKVEIHKLTNKHGISIQEQTDLQNARNAAPRGSSERAELNKQISEQEVWQQSGSKVIFTIDENKNQICSDGYCSQFKSKVIKTLKNAQSHTYKKDKQNFLRKWEEKFDKLNDDEISKIIEDELNNPNTELKKHANPFSSLFKDKEANAYIKFKDLLEHRRRTMLSPIKTIQTGYQFSF